MKNYDLLFNTEYNESTKIDETVTKYYFQEDYEGLLNYLKSIGCKYLYTDNYDILYAISDFTKIDSDLELTKRRLEAIKHQEDVQDAKIEIDEKFNLPKIVIKRDDCTIEAFSLSKFYPESLENLPYIELNDRFGTCFETVYEISRHLKNDNEIVSGHIFGYTDKSRYAHIWNETRFNSKEVVIDGIFNAIFNKEGYYAITSAKPISKVPRNVLIDDVHHYMEELTKSGENSRIPPELYYFFRDEIVSELDKNELIFKKR